MDIDTSITAMILAGGLGSRLRPVVSDRPKCLSLVLGRPFIMFLLDQLEKAEIRSVILCTGYMAEQVHKTLGYSYNSLS
ncbi:MAG: sugar phosphate nucleotidyltransferase, partial [Desulfatirhabdiaceae bacterium]